MYRYQFIDSDNGDNDAEHVVIVQVLDTEEGRCIEFRLSHPFYDYMYSTEVSGDEWEAFWDELGRRFPHGYVDTIIADIDEALTWDSTRQGHNYWSDLYTRFYRHLDTSEKLTPRGLSVHVTTPETYEVL